jgi:hypothetical protein
MNTFKFAVFCRKKITINTDPQRRCYDGCNFSEKAVWSEWKWVLSIYASSERGRGMGKDSRLINPKRQYKVEERE